MSRLWNSQNSTKKSASKNPWNKDGGTWKAEECMPRHHPQFRTSGLFGSRHGHPDNPTRSRRTKIERLDARWGVQASTATATSPTKLRRNLLTTTTPPPHPSWWTRKIWGWELGFKVCLWKRISCFLCFLRARFTTKHYILVLPSQTKNHTIFELPPDISFGPMKQTPTKQAFFLFNWSTNSCNRIRSSPNIAEDHDSKSKWRTQ